MKAIYTRDVCPRSLGFVTRHRLPLGYGGVVEITDRQNLVDHEDLGLKVRRHRECQADVHPR